MKKTLTALTLALLASHAFAGFTKEGDLKDLAQNPADGKLQQSIQGAMIKDPQAPKAWLKAWSQAENQSSFGDAWSEVGLNLLRWSQPGKAYEWKAARRIPGENALAYQQDSLVDLERAQAYQLTYPLTTGSIHSVDIADTANGQYQFIGTSERRMVTGLPPIGPDNAPVQLCKLGRSSAAPYIEMSETQRQVFTEQTGMDFSYCLSGQSSATYWQQRYSDFVRSDYTHTDNLSPGASW